MRIPAKCRAQSIRRLLRQVVCVLLEERCSVRNIPEIASAYQMYSGADNDYNLRSVCRSYDPSLICKYFTQHLSIDKYSNTEYAKVNYRHGWEEPMNYRERLRNIREDRDLTQADIGKVLNKSQQGYNHIEIGRAELKIDDLAELCRYYNLSADYIIGLVDKPVALKRK